MASYCTYCESDVSPVRRGNYNTLDTNLAKVHHTLFLQWVFTIYGCYIKFHIMLITALYYFHDIYNDPPGNAPLCENDPQQNGHTLFTGNK